MSETNEPKKRLIVIRIRGNVGIRKPIKETLQYLRLFKVNHAVLIDDRTSYNGMLQKAKDYITWGQIEKPTLFQLLKERGRLMGNLPLTDEHIKKYTKYNSLKEFSDALFNLETEIMKLPHIKPIFRLHPPKKGFRYSKKRPYKSSGELGNRGIEINSLLIRMI
ncbi:MAG: 50S ribosomal protein L30 [Candidatus Helarchaeota archaeon]|nr:50S ribosomal protein L30 [Candidatus Helarchaeota archaeon]